MPYSKINYIFNSADTPRTGRRAWNDCTVDAATPADALDKFRKLTTAFVLANLVSLELLELNKRHNPPQWLTVPLSDIEHEMMAYISPPKRT